MIPQNLRDILSNEDNSTLLQLLSLFLLMLFFVSLMIYVFGKSKRHYDDVANTPLDDDDKTFNF